MTANLCRFLCAAGVVTLLAGGVLGQSGPASRPATRPAAAPAAAAPAGVPLKVTAKSVAGPASKLRSSQADAKWEPLQAGDVLDELTVIRTGFGGKVVLAFADNSEVEIGGATKVGIAQFRKDGPVTRTALGLKYGAIQASVEKARGPNDFNVATPVATLAVRGSGAAVGYTGDFGFRIRSHSGSWAVRMGYAARDVGGNEGTNNELTPSAQLVTNRETVILSDPYGQPSNETTFNSNNNTGRGDIGGQPGSGGTNGIVPSSGISGAGVVHVPGLDDTLGK